MAAWLPPALLDADDVVSGAVITVRCALPPPPTGASAPVVAIAEPYLPVVSVAGEVTQLRTAAAGTYALRCGTADGSAVGAATPLTVQPGAPVRVTVVLSAERSAAGEVVVAKCGGVDAAGNAVVPPSASRRVQGQADVPGGAPRDAAASTDAVRLTAASFTTNRAVAMQAIDGRSLALRPTAAGPLAVRCAVHDWPELASAEAAVVQVGGGAPKQLRAVLPAARVLAGQAATVRCLGHDAWGNAQEHPSARLLAQGPGPVHAADGQLRAEVAGIYQVRCVAQGAQESDEVTSAPVALAVTPGVPTQWQVDYHQQRCLAKGAQLPLVWRAKDAYGNALYRMDVPATLTTDPPAEVVRDASGGFVLHGEGHYQLTLTADGEAGATLPPWRGEVVVDSTPPKIVIHSPARGQVLVDGNTVQLVEGEVDAGVSTLKDLTINGVTQVLAPNTHRHRFAVPIEAPWGVSVLYATAEDSCGNIGTLAQGVTRSAAFGPVSDAPNEKARVPNAMRAAVAQPLWDDGDSTGGHDISTLLQQGLQHGGLNERLPKHLAAISFYPFATKDVLDEVERPCWPMGASVGKQNGIEVTRNGPLRMRGPEIEFLHVEEGGAHMALRFDDVRLPVEVTLYYGLYCGAGSKSTLRATLAVDSLRLEVRGRVAMRDGAVAVELCDDCISTEWVGAKPTFLFDDPEAPGNAGFMWSPQIANALLQRNTGSLRAALSQRVRHDVVEETQRLMRNLTIDRSLPVPGSLLDKVRLESGIDGIVLRGGEQGGGTSEISLFSQTYAPIVTAPLRDKPAGKGRARGPIRQETQDLLPLALDDAATFAVSIRDDMLNQMLWTLWANGTFTHIDPRALVRGMVGNTANLLDNAKVDLSLTSPVVMMPGTKPNEVRLGVVDVFGSFSLDTSQAGAAVGSERRTLDAEAYCSVILSAKLGIDKVGRTLTVEPTGKPEIKLEIVGDGAGAVTEAVRHKLMRLIEQSMPAVLTRPLSAFPLPALEIGRLPGIPDGAAWQMQDVELERPAGAQAFILRGRLEGLDRVLEQNP